MSLRERIPANMLLYQTALFNFTSLLLVILLLVWYDSPTPSLSSHQLLQPARELLEPSTRWRTLTESLQHLRIRPPALPRHPRPEQDRVSLHVAQGHRVYWCNTDADLDLIHRITGIFWKCARIGERLSPYMSLCCGVMAVRLLLPGRGHGMR